jgi:hypothetical protein
MLRLTPTGYREHAMSRGQPNKLYRPSKSSYNRRMINEYLTIIYFFRFSVSDTSTAAQVDPKISNPL